MKNIAVFSLGLVLSCFLMLGFQQPYFKWVDSGGLATLSLTLDHVLTLDEPFSTAWLRKDLPILRERAIDSPTQENIEAYMYAQRVAMDKAQNFAEATQDESKFDQLRNSAATQETAKYAFYLGCLGIGMLLGMAMIWGTIVLIIALFIYGCGSVLLYVGLPLFLYLMANYLAGGRIHNKVMNYLHTNRESNRPFRNKFNENLERFVHPVKSLIGRSELQPAEDKKPT